MPGLRHQTIPIRLSGAKERERERESDYLGKILACWRMTAKMGINMTFFELSKCQNIMIKYFLTYL